jgi:hypothetical protein
MLDLFKEEEKTLVAAKTAQVMEMIQCWGSTYSTVGGPFDTGDSMKYADEMLVDINLELHNLVVALVGTQKMISEAHPKFNWGGSFLDANAITLLNRAPLAVGGALVVKESIYE